MVKSVLKKQPIRIFALCGSLAAMSANKSILKEIARLFPQLTVEIFDGLQDIPAFSPDVTYVPATVAAFKNGIRNAQAVLVSTPEYAMGVPGALKNALDWTVSTADFYDKPVGLITASSSGEKAHAALLNTLLVLGALMTDQTQLHISFIKSKVDAAGSITNTETAQNISHLVNELVGVINIPCPDRLQPPAATGKNTG